MSPGIGTGYGFSELKDQKFGSGLQTCERMFVGSCRSGFTRDQICLICLDATLISFMYTMSALIDWCDITHSSPDEKNCIDQLFGGEKRNAHRVIPPFFFKLTSNPLSQFTLFKQLFKRSTSPI